MDAEVDNTNIKSKNVSHFSDRKIINGCEKYPVDMIRSYGSEK